MKIFGKRLRASIAAHGISEAEYARKTDISPQNLSHYIAGQRKPGLDVLVTMINALPNEDVRWLIGVKSCDCGAAATAQSGEPVGEIWEYSFIHSSATGRGDSKVGPCLTYDKKQAFGIGCIEQRLIYTTPQPAQMERALTCALCGGCGPIVGCDACQSTGKIAAQPASGGGA